MPPRGCRGRSRAAPGFTLLEMLVVLLLMALAIGAASYTLGGVGQAHARAEAYRLSAAIRYMYGRAITDGAAYRIVVDLDSGRISAERLDAGSGCGARLTLDTGAKKRFQKLARQAIERQKEKAADEAKRGQPGQPGPPVQPEAASFGDFSDMVLKAHQMPKAVHVSKMATYAHRTPVEEGLLYIHVFPNGMIERAIVVFTSDDEQVYSVVTEPYQGSARVYSHEVPLSEVF